MDVRRGNGDVATSAGPSLEVEVGEGGTQSLVARACCHVFRVLLFGARTIAQNLDQLHAVVANDFGESQYGVPTKM